MLNGTMQEMKNMTKKKLINQDFAISNNFRIQKRFSI